MPKMSKKTMNNSAPKKAKVSKKTKTAKKSDVPLKKDFDLKVERDSLCPFFMTISRLSNYLKSLKGNSQIRR